MANLRLCLALTSLLLLSIALAPFSTYEIDTARNGGQGALQSNEPDINGATSTRSTACSGTVCLSEILINAVGGETDAPGSDHKQGEWVEIHNSGTQAVDLSSWNLEDHYQRSLSIDTTRVHLPAGATDVVLAAGDYIVIARNGVDGGCGLCLKNSNGEVTLKDGSGAAVDSATWTTSPSEGKTAIRDPSSSTADWVASAANTPGVANSGNATPIPTVDTGVRIREILADPMWTNDNSTWPGGEWFEVHNEGNETVDLNGWYAVDGSGNNISFNETHLIEHSNGTTIEPDGRRVISIGSHGTYGVLNNGGDTIDLHLANGSIADRVAYSSVTSGRSIVTSGNSSWTTALWPTPGEVDALIVNGSSDLSLNEVMANATNHDATFPEGEWIEVRMALNSSSTVPLSGWTVRTSTGGSIPANQPANCTCQIGGAVEMAAGDFAVISTNGTGAEMVWSGDLLSLVNPNGVIVQTMDWSSWIPENRTLVPSLQWTGLWLLSESATPGAANPGQDGGVVNDDFEVRISEIFPNPYGNDTTAAPGGEWVEVVNQGNDTIDLTGWTIRVGGTIRIDSDSIIDADLNLEGGEHLTVYVNLSSAWLTNRQGTVTLRDPTSTDVHAITYAGALPNASLVADPHDENATWVHSPHPSPGNANPTFDDPYTGARTVHITEVMPQCSPEDQDAPLTGEWVELNNSGDSTVNLSRWSLLDGDGTGLLIQPGALWNQTDLLLGTGDRAVAIIPESFLDNSGDNLALLDPDGIATDQLQWSGSDDCDSLEPNNQGWMEETDWATPGESNPRPVPWDGETSVRFSRLMVEEVYERDHDWLELVNHGESPVQMDGWKISRNRSTAEPWISIFREWTIPAGQTLILTGDPDALWEDARIAATDGDVALNNMPFLPDGGGALQLIAPNGTVVDAVVYGTGETGIEGWTGPSISNPPNAEREGLIMMRGDGCDEMPDTDSAADWEIRWLRMGSSLFCGDPTFTSSGTLTPAIGPEETLGQLLDWLGATESSLHVHLYELASPELTEALVDLAQSGVEVTMLLEGEVYASESTKKRQRGYASLVADAGGTVLWMADPPTGTSPAAPYAFIHSKVAVRDGNSVWISSGNWKRTSQPLDGDPGNREWSLYIDSVEVATNVLQRMSWDEDSGHLHVVEWSDSHPSLGRPSSWDQEQAEPSRATAPANPVSFDGSFSGRLLTCPDDCIGGLIDLIDSANDTIDVSVQYFDMDWTWGWGENPLLAAIERAMVDRGVKVRILQNAAYADEDGNDVREMVHHVNDIWNRSMGLDATAILMSTEEGILKLHNKGMIIDSDTVLIGSINWGSNSALRNREMGLAIDHSGLAGHVLSSFEEDWNRVDSSTDTDGDLLPDYWEIANGLNRTSSSVAGSSISEQSHDPDGDGLNNLEEFELGGNPNSADTDGDCIGDKAEQTYADLTEGVNHSHAILNSDADGDGVPDGETWGCVTPESPDGEEGGAGDDANATGGEDNRIIREDALSTTQAKMLLAVVTLAGLALVGALLVTLLGRSGSVDDTLIDDVGYIFDAGPGLTGSGETVLPTLAPTGSEINQAGMESDSAASRKSGSVILDGTSVAPEATNEARERTVAKDDGMFGAPTLDGRPGVASSPPPVEGMDSETVQQWLDAGWTIEQIEAHQAQQRG